MHGPNLKHVGPAEKKHKRHCSGASPWAKPMTLEEVRPAGAHGWALLEAVLGHGWRGGRPTQLASVINMRLDRASSSRLIWNNGEALKWWCSSARRKQSSSGAGREGSSGVRRGSGPRRDAGMERTQVGQHRRAERALLLSARHGSCPVKVQREIIA